MKRAIRILVVSALLMVSISCCSAAGLLAAVLGQCPATEQLAFGTVSSVTGTVQAASEKSSFITNKKFAGTYSYDGKEGSFETGWYYLVIKKITAKGKVQLQLDRGGLNGSPLYQTEILTAKIEGKKAVFTYSEDGWGNKGKGTVTFKKNGSVVLKVKETDTAEGNRSTLELSKTVFQKIQ